MTVCGITAEYNPFHTGHLHHIAETRRSLGENAVIVCVMSGNFVQRGDFAVLAHWRVPEVLAYMAFVAIANFAQPSYELGYAFKLLRLMLLLFVGALDWIGLVLGCIVIVALLATTKPIVGKGYLYPLCPLDKKALFALLVRKPISRDNT